MNDFHVFGVRHLSPGASYHLLEFLNQKKPKCVLIEGPEDATELMPFFTKKGVKLPIALLAYTTELPIETVLYPFADYSPEYQAVKWANQNKAEVKFIDLPTDVLLKMKQKTFDNQSEVDAFYNFHNNLYSQLSEHYQENSYEDYWERNLEHNFNTDSYRTILQEQSTAIRNLVEDHEQEAVPYDYAYNKVREAYMKREIAKAIEKGFKPKDIVVICGAYHLKGILSDLAPMTDQEFKDLPRAKTLKTLMPYTYFRLSSRSGYGAGNLAPYYFELMWQAIQKNTIDDLAATYISKVAQYMRKQGHNASTASVIETVRLAQALSSLKSGNLPILSDIHDAVVTCIGGGELSMVAEALNFVDIGTAIGFLPEGVSQTPVQQDMNLELKRLKLENYKSVVAQELALDLRENIKVKTEAAAFIDLNRSTFFNRLRVLGINFAMPIGVSQDSATWSEKWVLQWSPEIEIQVVEANLKGETLEIAAAFQLKERLTECNSIAIAASIIRTSCICQLTSIFQNAITMLQDLLADDSNFIETANAAREIALLLQFGGIRRVNLEPLKPILEQLFIRASLLLIDASNCDDKASVKILAGINTLEIISQQQYELVNTEIWQAELEQLAWRDDLNTKLSGSAFAILLEHNLVSDEDCAKEVSRRLSPGVPADLGASWFEGMSSRNRFALLSRVSLWRELDQYVQTLDDEEFLRSLVFLRRAFGDFEPNQKNSIAELLGDLWGIGSEKAAEMLTADLTEAEEDKLNELSDFDFDF